MGLFNAFFSILYRNQLKSSRHKEENVVNPLSRCPHTRYPRGPLDPKDGGLVPHGPIFLSPPCICYSQQLLVAVQGNQVIHSLQSQQLHMNPYYWRGPLLQWLFTVTIGDIQVSPCFQFVIAITTGWWWLQSPHPLLKFAIHSNYLWLLFKETLLNNLPQHICMHMSSILQLW